MPHVHHQSRQHTYPQFSHRLTVVQKIFHKRVESEVHKKTSRFPKSNLGQARNKQLPAHNETDHRQSQNGCDDLNS